MASTTNEKRKYRRRTEEERIKELESRIEELKSRMDARKREVSPLQKQIPRLQKRLRDFAALAAECGRTDVYNTTIAFLAGLDRVLNPDQETLRHWNTEAVEDED